MQAVILAAGQGTRMEELTTEVPKPMLDVAGKPLLEYKLDVLPSEINEVIIIVGYLAHTIRAHFGSAYDGKHITYIEQEDRNGTAGALWQAKDVLKDRFLVMMGDDMYAREDIKACIADGDTWRLLVQQMSEMRRAGDVQLDADANIVAIIEGDKRDAPGLASTNMFLLDTRIFSCPMVPKQEGSLEFGLPQTALAASKSLGIRLEPVFSDKWIQVTTPKDLARVAEILKKTRK
jgi:bifunctional UDP-N-acetylglucosamine pyrophosphorylase/glucosamine-1-phosphate N-acetyltransferase